MTWWRDGAIYQVYPRSFQDSDGDGIGDLEGVRRRLPYLNWLGVDGVWLSPFYRSPMADLGYDVSDHCDVDPIFGTQAELIEISTWCSRGTHDTRFGVLNTANYYDGFTAFLDHAVSQGFLRPEVRERLLVAPDPEALLAAWA